MLARVALASALGLFAPALRAQELKHSPEEELLRVESARSEAIGRNDLKTLDEIYADDFAGVAGTGQLVTKQELFFRKGKYIVRVVMVGGKDAKAVEAKTQSAGRLIESRLK